MKAALFVLLLLTAAGPSHAAAADKVDNRSDVFASTCRAAVDVVEGKKESLPKDQSDLMQYAVKTSECFSYIQGFIDGHNMAAEQTGNTRQFCIPGGVAYIQIASLVIKASDDRPEFGHSPRETIVEYALKSTWPCGASGP